VWVHSADHQTVYSGDYYLVIKSNGHDPLQFGKKDGTSYYGLRFSRITEIDPQTNDSIPGTGVPLSGGWTLSNLTNHDGRRVEFKMTFEKPVGIAFLFKLDLSEDRNETKCASLFCLKFDVHIPSYSWNAPQLNPKLAIIFDLYSTSTSSSPHKIDDLSFGIQDSYFSIIPNATVSDTSSSRTIQATLNYYTDKGGDNGLWVIYDNFPEGWSLEHDPAFGINPSAPSNDSEKTTIIVVICVFVALFLLLIGSVVLYRKQKKYSQIR
jgi:hypothetical protein